MGRKLQLWQHGHFYDGACDRARGGLDLGGYFGDEATDLVEMTTNTALPVLAEIYSLSMAGRYAGGRVILTVVLDLLVVLDRLFSRRCQRMCNRYG